jgi:predicted transcriptional regulator
MSLTSHELAEFNRFAEQKLSVGDVASIEQLAREWTEAHRLATLVSDVSESEADIDAGRVHPADEVIADLRQKQAGRRATKTC